MPRTHHVAANNLDARALAYLRSGRGQVNQHAEVAILRLGSEPEWERPHCDGADITDRPELWTPYQRARRESFEARVARYRADGLIQ